MGPVGQIIPLAALLAALAACGVPTDRGDVAGTQQRAGAGALPEASSLAWLPIEELGNVIPERVTRLDRGPSGSVWAFLSDRKVRISSGGQRAFESQERLVQTPVLKVEELPTGLVYATQKGLIWVDDQDDRSRDRILVQGAVPSAVWQDEHLYFLKNSADEGPSLGVMQLGPDGIPKVQQETVPLASQLRQILAGGEGWLLAQTPDRLWHRIDLRTWKLEDLPAEWPSKYRKTLHHPQGVFLLSNSGLHWLPNSSQRLIPLSVQEPKEIRDFALSPDQERIWLLSKRNVLCWNISSWQTAKRYLLPAATWRKRYTWLYDRYDLTFDSIVEAHNGLIFVGSSHGLLVASPFEAQALDGLAAAAGFGKQQAPLRSIGFTAGGQIWFGGNDRLVVPGQGTQPSTVIPTFGAVLDAHVGDATLISTEQGLFLHPAGPEGPLPALQQTVSSKLSRDYGMERLDHLIDSSAVLNVNQSALINSVSLGLLLKWDRSDYVFRSSLQKDFSKDGILGPPIAGYVFSGGTRQPLLLRSFPVPEIGGTLGILSPGAAGRVRAIQSPSDFRFGGVVREPGASDWLFLDGNQIRRTDAHFDRMETLAPPEQKQAESSLYQQSNTSTLYAVERTQREEEAFSDLLAPDGSEKGGRALLVGDFSVWRRKVPDGWDPVIQTQPLKPGQSILGLLVEADGRSLLVGCKDCGQRNLFRVDPKGEITPLPLAAEKIGCGDNALLRDRAGKRTYLSSLQGLFVREGEGAPFLPVKQADGKQLAIHINAMTEDSRGRIWLAAGHTEKTAHITMADKEDERKALAPGSLWVIEPGKPPRSVDSFKTSAVSLALLSDSRTQEERIWVGGQRLLHSFNLSAEGVQPGKDILELLGRDEDDDREIRLASDGAKALLWAGRSAFMCSADACELLDLPKKNLLRMSSSRSSAGIVRAFADGVAVLALGRGDDGSYLWIRERRAEGFRYLGKSEIVHTIVRDQEGHILLGSEGGRVFELSPGALVRTRVDLFPSNPEKEGVVGPVKSVCPLPNDELLLLAWDTEPLLLRGDGTRQRLPISLRAWGSCLSLDRDRVLLRHADGVTLLKLSAGQDAAAELTFGAGASTREEAVSSLVAGQADGAGPRPIFLLTKGRVWKLDENAVRFARYADLPDRFMDRSTPGTLAMSGSWLWLWGSGDELAVLDTKSADARWQSYDTLDGQPVESVRQVVGTKPDEALIFGRHIVASASLHESGWQFKTTKDLKLSRTKHNEIISFTLGGRQLLALATSRGCSIKELTPDAQQMEALTEIGLIDRRDLTADEVLHVRWVEESKRLFVTTESEVAAFRLRSNGARIAAEKLASVRRSVESGFNPTALPNQKIYDIQVSESGRDAWLLLHRYGFQSVQADAKVVRWDVERNRVSYSLLPLFRGALISRLGPSVKGQPPPLLIYSPLSGWSLWRLGFLVNPQLQLHDRFLWNTTELSSGSLDPALDDLAGWNVHYMDDHLRAPSSVQRLSLPPDLIWPRERHQRLAVLERRMGDRTVRLVATSTNREIGPGVRELRLLLLIGLTGGLIFLVGQRIFRRMVRKRLLRAQFIPYVQGEAIQDPAKFFGRETLMAKLRDTIETTNYALIGEFRIGKTSIQRQLGLLLRSMVHKTHVFIPVFVDLQHLGLEGKDTFFAFLARHMFEESNRRGADLMAQSELSACKVAEDYDSFALQGDISLVLSALQPLYPERTPVLVFQIDEIALMERFSDDARLGLRAIFVNQPQAKVVLSGPRLARNPELDELSPWWNFLKVEEIEPLTPSEARALILRPVQGLFTFTDEAIEHIIARSEGRPLGLQMICADILRYKYAMRSFRRRITLADMREALIYAEAQQRKQAASNKEAS